MKITAREITERIYKMYATDSGWLFGLAPDCLETIETIIRIALKINEEDT